MGQVADAHSSSGILVVGSGNSDRAMNDGRSSLLWLKWNLSAGEIFYLVAQSRV